MSVIKCLHTQSDCFKKHEIVNQVGIVVHSTGANNPNIKRYSQPSQDDPNYTALINLIGENIYKNSWNNSGITKGVHYIIGRLADGTVATVQNLPENIACWGVGKGKKGSYNYSPTAHIQFEICEDGLNDEEYFKQIYREAINLCADICIRNDWKADIIVSHKEAHDKGYASNHGDVDHWLKIYGFTMDDFRLEVQKLIDEIKNNDKVQINNIPVNSDFKSYKINMRENPFYIYDSDGNKIGSVDEKAKLTVIDEKNGMLKIEAWINL